MLLHPQPPLPPIPENIARIARARFRRGNPHVLLRNRLWAVFADADFTDLHLRFGQPAYAVSLFPRREHEALVVVRARKRSAECLRLYARRQGVEGTMFQGVRNFGLRRARYRGLTKTGLQDVAPAVALNLDRLAAWFAEPLLMRTGTFRFATFAA